MNAVDSDDGAKAVAWFKVPAGLAVSLFAAEPMLAKPVAFGFDERGRILVCETLRQGKFVRLPKGEIENRRPAKSPHAR